MGKSKKANGASERVATVGEKVACLVPDCTYGGNKTGCRGLCHTHYHGALRLVKAERISWAKLEAAGKALPPSRARGGPLSRWFLGEDDNGGVQ